MNTTMELTPQRAPYPIDAFFSVPRDAGHEVARNIGAPQALIGMGLISAISMACQGLVDVKLPTGQLRPVSQNLLIIAESGERKSTVYSLLLKPFYEADRRAINDYYRALNTFKAELDGWEAQAKGITRAITKLSARGLVDPELAAQLIEHAKTKPEKPRLRQFLRQDLTAKAIMEALEGDGESIAVTTDEGHVLFKSSAMSNIGLLSQLWDSPEIVPMGRAKHENLLGRNPRVSICIMTQKAALKAYLDRQGSVTKGSGHWARYLVAWPESTMGYRYTVPDEPTWEQLQALHARIRELLAAYQAMIESGQVTRDVVEFSTDAKCRWVQLVNATEDMLRKGGYLSDIADFANKVMEITARLAAAIHYFAGESGDISLDTLERAFTIVRWHIEEYKYLFSPQHTVPQDQVDAIEIARFLRRHAWGGPMSDSYYPRNMLLNRGPVRNKVRMHAALELLAHQGGVEVGKAAADKKTYVRLMNTFFGNVSPW